MPDILFFRSPEKRRPEPARDAGDRTDTPVDLLEDDLAVEVWRPSRSRIRPAGLNLLPYAVWWLFDACGIFSNDNYGIFLFRQQGCIVHRTCVFPAYFRFPFMARSDLQVGDIWTDESRRGKGLAREMLRQIMAAHAGKRIWFLCEATNTASASLAKAAGMVLHGTGRRESRFGIGLLGRFVVDSAAAG